MFAGDNRCRASLTVESSRLANRRDGRLGCQDNLLGAEDVHLTRQHDKHAFAHRADLTQLLALIKTFLLASCQEPFDLRGRPVDPVVAGLC